MSVTYEGVSDTYASQGGTTLAAGSAVMTGAKIPSGSGTGWLAVIGWGNATDTPPLYDDDIWDLIDDVEGGEGTWIADSGIRHVSLYWHEGATLPDPQTFTNGGGLDPNNLIVGCVVRASKSLTYWERPQIAGGPDNVGGGPFSASLNRDPGGATGDLVIWGVITPNSTVNPAGLTLTWPGVTGTATLTLTTSTGAGHNARIRTHRTAVTSGESTGDAPSVTSTTTFTGAAFAVRLRDTNTQPLPVPVAAAGGDAIAEPYLPIDLDGGTSSYLPGATFEWEVIGTPTGTVVIDDDTALTTTATVTPADWGDGPITFRLTVTDAGGTSTDDKVVTVLRTSETTGDGDPLHLTFGG